MQYRFIFVVALCLLFIRVFAAQPVTVKFAGAAPRSVWSGARWATPKDATHTEKDSVTVTPSSGDTHVFVLDEKTGNVASAALSAIKAEWTPQAKDFNLVGTVIIRITYNGQPISAAQVEFQDSKRKQSTFLDPSSAGQLTFNLVAPGSVKVKVNYKSEGKDAAPVTQEFDIPLGRTVPNPIYTVAVPEKASTIVAGESASGEPTKKASATPVENTPNPVGKIIGMFLGLIVIGAAVFFAMQYMKKNPEQVTEKLTQLGVDVPKPPDPEPDDLPIPAPIAKSEPPQQIILDSSPMAPPVAQAISATGSGPRLVSEQGDVIPLDDGVMTVGREVGLGLSLADESTVSRNHASLTRSDSSVVVKDLGSTNGTYVNGVKVTGDVTLQPGDAIQFGAVRFRFEA